MVVAKLQGGLGNQMFQYAAARSLVKANEPVYLDHGFFTDSNSTDTFTARQYELDIFKNIRAKKAGNKLIDAFKSRSLRDQLKRLTGSYKIIQQNNNEYIPLQQFASVKHIYLDGYFQSERYFISVTEQLKYEFQFPLLDAANAAVKDQIEKIANSVSIHIRRADYLKPFFSAIHPVLPLKYYYDALSTLQEEHTTPGLFIFSDDMDWVKQNFSWPGSTITYIENNTGKNSWKDMALMAACQHHIIANSSFSWWGAWLSGSEGKAFAPYNWFNPATIKFNIRDVIPQCWNIVQYE